MDEIPGWAIDEAQKRIDAYDGPGNAARNVLAKMIVEHETAPVDPDVLAVRAICAAMADVHLGLTEARHYLEGLCDNGLAFQAVLAAYREHASKRNG